MEVYSQIPSIPSSWVDIMIRGMDERWTPLGRCIHIVGTWSSPYRGDFEPARQSNTDMDARWNAISN